MNRQRHAIYGDRRKVLEGADVEQQLRSTVDTVVEQYVLSATEGFSEEWDLEQLWTTLNTLYPVGLKRSDYEEEDVDRQQLVEAFKADAQDAYDRREEALGPEVMRELERRVMLTVLDRKWREHLYEMDYLREGIGLRAMAQRDPLVEYQREGGAMFNAMMEAFMEEVVGFVFHLEVEVAQTPSQGVGVVAGADGRAVQIGSRSNGSRPDAPLIESGPDPDGPGVEVHAVGGSTLDEEQLIDLVDGEPLSDDSSDPDQDEPSAAGSVRPQVQAKGLAGPTQRNLAYTAAEEDGSVKTTEKVDAGETENAFAGVGRNAPCPCGSGKKFKMCHGRPGTP